MATYSINNDGLLIIEQNATDKRAFVPSRDIKIFPCSRRGQYGTTSPVKFYDPEARLNTEHTNRLHTAVNGYKDTFIVNEDFSTGDTLVFVLAGYYVKINNFDPSVIANALGLSTGTIYAHLSLHDNVFLNVEGYHTEILYRQSTSDNDINSLDVTYTANDKTDDFFVGISFAGANTLTDKVTDTRNGVTGETTLASINLPLFSKIASDWVIVQTSLLPYIEHDTTEDSIKIIGKLTVKQDITTPQLKTNKITSDNTEIVVDKVLKVNTINSDSTSGLTVKRKLTVEKDIVVTAGNEVNTPQLRVDRITSSNTDNTITIDNKKLVVNRSLEMRAPKPTEEKPNPDPAKATIEQAVIGDLTVKKDSELNRSTGSIKADGYINVGSPVIPTKTIGDIVAKNSIFAENHIAAKNTIKAPAIYQTVNSSDKPVPVIDIVEQNNDIWQLQISRVSKIEK